jgi:hypothetical protein
LTLATELLDAGLNLHEYIKRTHWNGGGLLGPDPGIRFNARAGRFIKSYLSWLPWSDDMAYMQAQGYWILDNWLLADLTGDSQYEDYAVSCAEFVLARQRDEGYWDYPNPEWRTRIATVEGCFGTLGLIESYNRTGDERFLAGANNWYTYMVDDDGTGFQNNDGMLAINYFANTPPQGGGVPNNTTLVLWLIAELHKATGDDSYFEFREPMVEWLRHVQLPDGELPYAVGGDNSSDRPHFLCYQYNSFEFMDLVHYHRMTGDDAIWPVIERLAGYLAKGLTDEGAARYDCHHDHPEVTYYSSAVAQALSQAKELGVADSGDASRRAFKRVLSQQRPDGGFKFYSQFNYGFLRDTRSYPRYLSMILNHLLREHLTQLKKTE